jgi:hypothetical protein
MLGMVSQLTIANLHTRIPSMSPTQRLALYRRALESPYEPTNAVTIAVLESWEGGYPQTDAMQTDAERTAAASYGRLRAETRLSRVPVEVAEVEQALASVGASIKTAARLGATPINPTHQPDIAQRVAQEEEREALEAAEDAAV